MGLMMPLTQNKLGDKMKPKKFPKESISLKDEKTGNELTQLTSDKSIHHHPFFHVNSYSSDQNKLYFISYRSSLPQIMFADMDSLHLFQISDLENLNEWSINPSLDGKYVYYTAAFSGWRVEVDTGKEEKIIDFQADQMMEKGMVAAAMGTTCLSNSGKWWGVTCKVADKSRFIIINTENGESTTILEGESISHMQFCPDDDEQIFYAGPLTDRVWTIRRDGSGNQRVYEKKPLEWITHESWLPKTKEIAFVDWPNGMRAVNIDTKKERQLTNFNAWHAISNHAGNRIIADTNFPDIGLQIFNPFDENFEHETICLPNSSSVGEHWNGPFPYGKGPIKVYAPQNTHPHPRFSPDDRKVVYTSDCSGFSQIYEVSIPNHHWSI